MEVQIRVETLKNLLKIFEDKLVLDLNEIKALKDKMNVENLSVLFPGLALLYPDEPKKKILMKLSFKLPKENSLVDRDYNLFLFSNI